MKISDLLALSFENLRRRLGRTSLTIVGVVVGTCAIVVMLSLGIALSVGFTHMLEQWGDLTKIDVYNWNQNSTNVLDDAAVKAFKELEFVTVATPIYESYQMNAQMLAGPNDRYRSGNSITGMQPDAMEALGYELVSGKYLPDTPVANVGSKRKIQVLVGENASYNFNDTKKRGQDSYRWKGATDAAGNLLPAFVDFSKDKVQLVLMKQSENAKDIVFDLEVIGVMKEDYAKGYVTGQGVVMDLNELKKIEAEYKRANGIKDSAQTQKGYSNVVVKVDNVDNVAAVEAVIKESFETNSMTSTREEMQKRAMSNQMLLGGLGAISLFVAALSIANTMTMAIYERTREIGVMKVLGCRIGRIRAMFLLEAAMIGFIGGVIGIAVSYALSFGLNFFGPQLSQMGLLGEMGGGLDLSVEKLSIIPWWLAVAGIAFSTVIGIVAGIAPAGRAVKISALEAIRHE